MERIRQLQEREKDLMRSLKEVREFMHQEYERYVAETYKVKPGTIVKDCASQLYNVHGIYYNSCCWKNKPWLYVYKQKLDGSFGKRIYTLMHSWEVVE